MSLRVDLFRVEDLEAVLAGLVLHGDGAPLRSDVAVLPGDLSRAVGLLLAAVLLLVAGGRVREGGGGVLQQYDISGGRHEDKKVSRNCKVAQSTLSCIQWICINVCMNNKHV